MNKPMTRPDTLGPGNRPSINPTGPLPTTRPAPPSLGGNRPSTLPGDLNRPSLGGPNRPTTLPGNLNRPAPGDFTRPAPGGINRPTTLPGDLNRPSLGGTNRPGGINGGINRPTTLPGDLNRPSLGGINRPTTLPGDLTPTTRPNFPSQGNRPGGGYYPGGNRPDYRPGGGYYPGGNRPDNRPGGYYPGGNRPGGNNWNDYDRPIIGGVNRPSNRPNYGDYNRPIIGGGNNNTFINNNVTNNNVWNNFNNSTNININNRPGGWSSGWGAPGWGSGWGSGPGWGTNWGTNWGYRPGFNYGPGWGAGWNYNTGWGSHHSWYSGSWNNYCSSWYRPSSSFLVGWGLGSLATYATTPFFNPYFVATPTPVYSYSQPIVIQSVQPVVRETESIYIDRTQPANVQAQVQPAPAGQATTQVPAPPTPDEQGLTAFNDGMALFKEGQYPQALAKFDTALAKLPGDPVVHEMRALTLFSLGQYQESAAVLNSLLAAAPGMDWTTMSGLYGNVDDYTTQLRALENHISSKPDDAAARFVLAYHYLVTGNPDDAAEELEGVVKLQPKDTTAQQILSGLKPPAPAKSAADTAVAAGATARTAEAAKPAVDEPTTDLVGSWKATNPDVTIELTVTEDFKFTWKATPKGQAPVELSGNLNADGSTVVLETENQGSMPGVVKSEGPGRFRFTPPGAPASDPGLTFERQK
jgi:Flp pilus assembly protein TadD